MRCPYCDSELDSTNYCSNCNQEFDFSSRIDNGESICLNCTFWQVSPYGSAYGMVCNKGSYTEGPGDSCSYFIPESYHASYGDSGQYQFNETSRRIADKLWHWQYSR